MSFHIIVLAYEAVYCFAAGLDILRADNLKLISQTQLQSLFCNS